MKNGARLTLSRGYRDKLQEYLRAHAAELSGLERVGRYYCRTGHERFDERDAGSIGREAVAAPRCKDGIENERLSFWLPI